MGDRHSDLTPPQPESPVPGGDTVPRRGDTTPEPEPAEGVAELGEAAGLAGGRDTVPFRGDSAPLPDAPEAPGAAGGAGETLGEAVRAVEGGVESAGGPALERDLGRLVDAAGQGWDVKAPADIFRSGPNAGERMPAGQPGAYDGDVFEDQLDGALAKGLNVIVDTSGLSRDANADARRRADERPEWAGRVLFR
ncbi:hypothetical protein ACQP1P_25235 [Dactylosporangium sp. CA-052675]|uniref:hypothetical protein n=1 Tax=Dactylosporangium sp. CA-052675 TaxID=3239927 RepID=UPI003D8D0332